MQSEEKIICFLEAGQRFNAPAITVMAVRIGNEAFAAASSAAADTNIDDAIVE